VGVGRAAVRAACGGASGVVMSIQRKSGEPYRVFYSQIPATTVANQIRRVDDRFINAAGNHVTDDCCRYLLPLIQGEVRNVFRKGLPVHLLID
ncbi:MAG: 6-phosphofructokinase, partial [Clostridia bacterium]|nr:6-phosphofructokinase [Clostridia bacterium]